MKAIGAALFKSVGAGYRAVNAIGRDQEIEIIEFSPLGAQSHVIISGPIELVKKHMGHLHYSDVVRTEIIKENQELILKAFLGLQAAPLKKSLIILESHFVGDLFKYANQLILNGADIIDLRVQRVTGSPGYLMATSDLSADDIKLRKGLPDDQNSFTCIDNLSSGLKEFFDINPT